MYSITSQKGVSFTCLKSPKTPDAATSYEIPTQPVLSPAFPRPDFSNRIEKSMSFRWLKWGHCKSAPQTARKKMYAWKQTGKGGVPVS